MRVREREQRKGGRKGGREMEEKLRQANEQADKRCERQTYMSDRLVWDLYVWETDLYGRQTRLVASSTYHEDVGHEQEKGYERHKDDEDEQFCHKAGHGVLIPRVLFLREAGDDAVHYS